MVTSSEQSGPVIQNMGLVDRVARFLIGGGILGYVVSYYEMKHPSLSLAWQTGLVAGSLYPLITAMIGWDPVYAWLKIRSCRPTGRHQCGTLPYQFRAILGRAPKYCEECDEHSLEACHDSPQANPRHAVWAVDREPIIYPTGAQLDGYFMEQARKHAGQQPPEHPPAEPGGLKHAA